MPVGPPAFLFLDEGRGEGLDRSGVARASPAAAIPTVLEAISFKGQRIGRSDSMECGQKRATTPRETSHNL